ncbi:putative hydrolase of the HAD superfamily [Nocardioides albertanoniae]|uniref:Putative hydrolase of the HAD superfamily n=1 Tax=Nocardioides albertanoniae TaxID=1175486 RepID=A0A543A586_9ACTN|nr:HAD family hydrolase [Nocardioides albertanoniae]TQL67760.1 putative hydrolase of the HAD superfamily [Nocardioides albertanoniae]
MLRAIIFDLDDTLVDQAGAARVAVTGWAAEHGVTGDVEARWDAISGRHYERYQRREISFHEQRRERTRDFLGTELDDAEADALFAGYLKRYEAQWVAFDDAVPTLRRVHEAGLRAVVLTNGEDAHQRLKLDLTGLAAEVDLLVSTSTLPASKPDPRAYRLTCERAGVAPAEALMVGNSLAHDVLGAIDAGLDAVLVDRHDAHPDAHVRRVASLDALVW